MKEILIGLILLFASLAQAEERKIWSGELSIEPLRYGAPEITFVLKGGGTLKVKSVKDIEVVQEGGRGFREGLSDTEGAVQNFLSVFTFYYTKGVNADLRDKDVYFRDEKVKRVSAYTINGDYERLDVLVRTGTKDYRLKFIKEVEDGEYCCILHFNLK